MSCNCESSMNVHWCILHIHTSECVAHLHFHSPNFFLRRFLTILTLSMLKNTSLQAILKNNAFECIFYSCWLISNISPPNFRLYTKPLIIWMLSKNVQNLCIMCHSKILRAAPYFAHLSNFKITTNTQISSKSQGSALAIFEKWNSRWG